MSLSIVEYTKKDSSYDDLYEDTKGKGLFIRRQQKDTENLKKL